METRDAPLQSLRTDLLACYHAALRAVNGRACVAQALRTHRPGARVFVIAVGKAAAAMTRGALDAWDGHIDGALLITKVGHTDPALAREPRVRTLESAHPVPDQRSLEAGQALLAFLQQLPPDAELVFLISGGASSLVEVPAPGLELDDLIRVNGWLLASGLDIAAMNAVRQGLSAIKGGRLIPFLGGRRSRALLISDVQGDDLGVIGSGLLVPADPQGWRSLSLPAWLHALLQRSAGVEVPAASDIELELVATLDRAMAAAAEQGRSLGYPVTVDPAFQRGDACAAGERLASTLLAGGPGLYLWGGETTVRLPPEPGRGGRCQTLALCAARSLDGTDGVALLAAGSDGSDGPGEDAGALVDGGTVARAGDAGLEVDASLARADAGSFLEGAGDLIQTGPTGTNVMDLMIGGRLA